MFYSIFVTGIKSADSYAIRSTKKELKNQLEALANDIEDGTILAFEVVKFVPLQVSMIGGLSGILQ